MKVVQVVNFGYRHDERMRVCGAPMRVGRLFVKDSERFDSRQLQVAAWRSQD